MSAPTLTEFVLARIAERQAVAEIAARFNFNPERLQVRTTRILAAVDDDHPDFRAEWRP